MFERPVPVHCLTSAILCVGLLVGTSAGAAAVAPALGQAGSFAVLGNATVGSTGPSVISGDIGVFPGATLTGFPPAVQSSGLQYVGNVTAQNAEQDAMAAYTALSGQPCDANLTGQDLGGMHLFAGVYCFSASATLTGTLTLDAQGDANAVFIFRTGSTLITAAGAAVQVIGGGSNCNVFWQVGSSATLGTTTAFAGNILALVSITVTTGASVAGRVLALNGAVTLDSNPVAICAVCGVIVVSPAGLPAAKVSASYSQLLTATGATAPYTFAVTAGALPLGLALGADGTLAGTPTVANTFAFTAKATDAAGCTGSADYNLTVNPSGGSAGDPHLRTLDGLAYDFQACGDFILITSGDRALEVQVRQKPRTANLNIAFNAMIAVKLGGHSLVIAPIGTACNSTAAQPDACVRFDGQAVNFACAGGSPAPGCARFSQQADGNRIDEVQHLASSSNCAATTAAGGCLVQYIVSNAQGESVTACVHNNYLDVRVAANPALHPLSGLLGNADGNPANDLQLRAGEFIALTPSPNYAHFYSTFGESWRVPHEQSLLGPDAEADVVCGTEPFSVANLSDQARNHATQTCLGLGIAAEVMADCVLDAAVLGDAAALAFVGLAAPRAVLALQKEAANCPGATPSADGAIPCSFNGKAVVSGGCTTGATPDLAATLACAGLLAGALLVGRLRRRSAALGTARAPAQPAPLG